MTKRLCATSGARCLGECPCAHHARVASEGQIDALRTVLRTLAAAPEMSPITRALAMNTLEPGSGDKWLDGRRSECEHGRVLYCQDCGIDVRRSPHDRAKP